MYVMSRLEIQLQELFFWLDRVVAVEAGQAEMVVFKARSCKHALEAQVTQAVQANELPNFFNGVAGCYQLTSG